MLHLYYVLINITSQIKADLKDIADSVPDHLNKASIAIKPVIKT